jgi:hypothetical protein
MSHVTVHGGHSCTLHFDSRSNHHIARQLADLLADACLPGPREHMGILTVSMAHAIQAGIVQLVHFDWDSCELGNEE